MQSLETLRWAKDLIQEWTQGKQYLKAGWDGMPTVHVNRECIVGLYFSLQQNPNTKLYDAHVRGYIRTCGGYNQSAGMRELIAECERIAALVLELERAEIHVSESAVQMFCEELSMEAKS